MLEGTASKWRGHSNCFTVGHDSVRKQHRGICTARCSGKIIKLWPFQILHRFSTRIIFGQKCPPNAIFSRIYFLVGARGVPPTTHLSSVEYNRMQSSRSDTYQAPPF